MDYSIIIPAFNEEKYLPRTLKKILASTNDLPGRGEIIVVDNNSTDRTAHVAHSMGARVVFEPVNQISRARNAGAQAALGSYLIFIDADTSPSQELLAAAIDALRSGRVCGGGSLLAMDRPLGVVEGMGVVLWNRISTTFQLAAGSFVFALKEGFEAVGGFSEKVYAGEEIIFSRALKKWGKRREMRFQVLDVAPVITSARKLTWHGAGTILRTFCVFLLFPFAVRHRSLCRLWYERPDASSLSDAERSQADQNGADTSSETGFPRHTGSATSKLTTE